MHSSRALLESERQKAELESQSKRCLSIRMKRKRIMINSVKSLSFKIHPWVSEVGYASLVAGPSPVPNP